MSNHESVYVIAYDIHRDGIRNRVVKIVEKMAVRVQFSVFEGRMNRKQMLQLKKQLALLIEEGDQVRFYHLNANDISASERLGGAPFPEEQEFWLL